MLNDVAPAVALDAPAISVKSVSKYYGQFPALRDVTFEIAPGASVALWGPNGAGKSTIMRCLLGLAKYEGSISINGQDPRARGETTRSVIGYVPQDLAPQPMTVGEMVTFIARLKRADIEQSLERLALLGIEEQINKDISALSGGMKQRLALALALVGHPTILLLDEPTANLDAGGRAELLQLLHRFKREGMTVVFSSHRPEDVLALADRILLLDGGELEEEQSPQRFKTLLGYDARLVVYLKNGHRDEAISTLQGLGLSAAGDGQVITVAIRADQKADVLSSLARSGVDIEDFEWERVAWTKVSS